VKTQKARESLRVYLKQIGGDGPCALFHNLISGREFTLLVPEELVRALAGHLFEEVEIDADVELDLPNMDIVSGKLLGFRSVTKGNAWNVWREWYKKNVAEWNGVKDIEGELGRGDK